MHRHRRSPRCLGKCDALESDALESDALASDAAMEGRRAMVQIHCLEVEFGSHATAWKDFREKVRL